MILPPDVTSNVGLEAAFLIAVLIIVEEDMVPVIVEDVAVRFPEESTWNFPLPIFRSPPLISTLLVVINPP